MPDVSTAEFVAKLLQVNDQKGPFLVFSKEGRHVFSVLYGIYLHDGYCSRVVIRNKSPPALVEEGNPDSVSSERREV
jgi:hypothetical protein